jgi:hypothetical protein
MLATTQSHTILFICPYPFLWYENHSVIKETADYRERICLNMLVSDRLAKLENLQIRKSGLLPETLRHVHDKMPTL